MKPEEHYRALENMYLAAPINEIFEPQIKISAERAEISIDIIEKFFHAANAVHGSVYFKMLDDAAYFAANSIEFERFVLTTEFKTNFTRPISSGSMKSIGKVLRKTETEIAAEAILYNDSGKEIGRGGGIFVRDKRPLVDIPGYREDK